MDDVPAIVGACQDPEILHWIPVILARIPKSTRSFVRGEWSTDPGHQFAVTENDGVVGSIGMRVNEADGNGRIATGARRRREARRHDPRAPSHLPLRLRTTSGWAGST